MAFPAVQTGDTQNGTVTSNDATWDLTYPTNLIAGDLILGLIATDGNVGGSWPAGFVADALGPTANKLLIAKKLSDGTETGTFTVTVSGAEQGGWRVFRITGWEGTLGTGWQNGSDPGSVVRSVTATGASTTPNPNSLDPETWATEDTLWIAACTVDTSRTISAYPLADLNTADVSGGSGGATLGVCVMNDAVSSKDPGTFTISASDDWGAITIAIRPAAPSAPASLLLPNPNRHILQRRF